MMKPTTWERTSLEWWIRRGAIGGLAGGSLSAVYLVAFAALEHGIDAVFTPLRAVAAIVLGPEALDGDYPVLVAATVGSLVHLAFSMFFGVLFAGFIRRRARSRPSGIPLPLSASVYGLALWVVNLYVIAPASGWPWLTDASDLIAQLLAHTCAFGAVLGIYLGRTLPRGQLWTVDLIPAERWEKAGKR